MDGESDSDIKIRARRAAPAPPSRPSAGGRAKPRAAAPGGRNSASDSDSDAGFDIVTAARSSRSQQLVASPPRVSKPGSLAGAPAPAPASLPHSPASRAQATAEASDSDSDGSFDLITVTRSGRSLGRAPPVAVEASGRGGGQQQQDRKNHQRSMTASLSTRASPQAETDAQRSASLLAPGAESTRGLRTARPHPPAASPTPSPAAAAPLEAQPCVTPASSSRNTVAGPLGPVPEVAAEQQVEEEPALLSAGQATQPTSEPRAQSHGGPEPPPAAAAVHDSRASTTLSLAGLAASAQPPAMPASGTTQQAQAVAVGQECRASSPGGQEAAPASRHTEPPVFGASCAASVLSPRPSAGLPPLPVSPAALPDAVPGEEGHPVGLAWQAAPWAPALPQGPSLAALGDIVSQSVNGAMQGLRADIQGLSAKWEEQAAATAGLQERVAASSREVDERLTGILGELSAQKQRLELVERAQSEKAVPAAPAPVSPAKAPATAATPVLTKPVFESQPASPASTSTPTSPDKAASVEAIMQRLSLLESRVSAQLSHLEYVCTSPAAAQEQGGGSTPPRRAGTPAPLQRSCCPSPGMTHAELAASRAPKPAAPPSVGSPSRPASPELSAGPPTHSPQQADAFQHLFAGIRAAGVVHSPGGASRMSSPSRLGTRVDRQVAETHALIQGIQDQIAQIKGSLAVGSLEAGRGRAEQGVVNRRLAQLEQNQHVLQSADKYKAILGQVHVEQAAGLINRMRALEDKVALLQRQADATEGHGQDVSLRLSALEWRVDKSTYATVSTLKAVEGRQDKLRTQLAGVRDAAVAAEAKGAALSGEMARLRAKVAGYTSPPRPLFRNY